MENPTIQEARCSGYEGATATRAASADCQRLAAAQQWSGPQQIPHTRVHQPAPALPAGQSRHPAAGVQGGRDTAQVDNILLFSVILVFGEKRGQI